jgi:hypothetical protein
LKTLAKMRLPPIRQTATPAPAPNFPKILGELAIGNEQAVKFPKRLRHRNKGKVLAVIYRQAKGYRLYWRERVDSLLTSAQARCQRAIEALARVRRLARNTPALQINIAARAASKSMFRAR